MRIWTALGLALALAIIIIGSNRHQPARNINLATGTSTLSFPPCIGGVVCLAALDSLKVK